MDNQGNNGQPVAEIGIIGGSGFYTFLDDPVEHRITTPFGRPSAPVSVGEVAGRRVAFLPRHGRDHQLPPHQVNYRANLWALRHLGVRQVLGPCAVGSLQPELTPGTIVLPDQVVDRTWGRAHTFVDAGSVAHVTFAEPYCPRGRAAVLTAGRSAAVPVTDGGTMVVINGPRFSTRAESRWHAAQGWSLVGMTGMPEAALARELALCYTSVALATDHDAGIEPADAVSHAAVLEMFATHMDTVKGLIRTVIGELPVDAGDLEDGCPCRRSLDDFADTVTWT